MGKVDVDGELSLSIGDKEVTLSLYQTPDLSEKDAQNICEMFADEIAESISENKYVELPPLRFTKETAKASNINMEAIVIDIDRQDLEEYESMKAALENVDDLKTECDLVDCSVADWNAEPVGGTEFETFACEEILELDQQKLEEIIPEDPRAVPVHSPPSDSVEVAGRGSQPGAGSDVTPVKQPAGLEGTLTIDTEAGAGNDEEIKQQENLQKISEEIPQIVGISADTKEPEKQIELQSEATNLDMKDGHVENKTTCKIEESSQANNVVSEQNIDTQVLHYF